MQGRRRRLSTVTLAMAAWLSVGLAAPLLFTFYSSDLGLRGVVAASRDSFTIDRPIELGLTPQVTIERGTIVLVNTARKESSGEPIETMLARGEAGLVLDGATILVSATRWTVPKLEGPEAPLVEAVRNQNWESLSIRRGTFILATPSGQVESLNDVQAEVALKRKGTVTVKGSALLRGQRVSFQVTAGTQVERKGAPSVPLKLHLRSSLLEASFDGRLGLGDNLQLSGQGEVLIERVRQVGRWFGAAWPSGGPGLSKFAAKGQFEWTGHSLDFDRGTFRMDGNEATGVLGLKVRGPYPEITGTLALRSLNLSPYLPAAVNRSGEPPVSFSQFMAGLLDLSVEPILGVDMRVSAERVTLGEVELGRSAATITFREGRLIADLAQLELAGGSGSGQIRADFTGYYPKAALRLKLDEVDLGRIVSAAKGRALVQGSGNVVADLAASGAISYDLVRTLSGRINIKAQNGKLGLDLKGAAIAAQSGESKAWEAALSGSTPYDQLDLRLVVREGVVMSETAELMAGDAVWSATGLISLPAGRMDVRLARGSKVGSARSSGEAASANPIEVRGPWSRPEFRTVPETSDAVGTGEWFPVPTMLPSAQAPDRG
ncbi:MAG TPA: AsmA-like C-terminal region-containing protein [Hyphomicrobiaceae bacterium]|nr:AsmA-like C-terminal region-containing protein [Hyphomicrobiaceae bacterium]